MKTKSTISLLIVTLLPACANGPCEIRLKASFSSYNELLTDMKKKKMSSRKIIH